MSGTFIDVRGGRLFLRRGGKGRTLLYLHGAQGFAGSETALAALEQHVEVLAPDHPGFGQSDALDSIDDVPDLAFFYLDLIAALGLSAVHIVGQSIGGWTALEMAVRSTARIASLTLAAAAGIRVKGVPRADMFICTPRELARQLFAGDGWAEWDEALHASPELQDIYDRNRFQAAKLCWQPRLHNPKLEKWLHRIDRPTLILWGEEDRIIPPAYGERLAALIAGARLTLVPRAGHLLQVEEPRRFAADVARFIDGVAP
jgi:pimeloyl-ACP methyl ester carboxylesterase